MTYSIGSVLYKATGSASEIKTFVEGQVFVHDVQIVYSGVVGSYTAFVLVDADN